MFSGLEKLLVCELVKVKVQSEPDDLGRGQHRVNPVWRVFRLELRDADTLVAAFARNVQWIHNLEGVRKKFEP